MACSDPPSCLMHPSLVAWTLSLANSTQLPLGIDLGCKNSLNQGYAPSKTTAQGPPGCYGDESLTLPHVTQLLGAIPPLELLRMGGCLSCSYIASQLLPLPGSNILPSLQL